MYRLAACPRPGSRSCWHRSSRSAAAPSPATSPPRRCTASRASAGERPRSPSREGESTAAPASRSTPAPTSTAARPWSSTASRSPRSSRTLLDIGRHVGDATPAAGHRVGPTRAADSTGLRSSRTLAHHARRGRPGIRRLRRVIVANIDRDEVTDSDFELLVLGAPRRSRAADARRSTTGCATASASSPRSTSPIPSAEDRHRARRRGPPAAATSTSGTCPARTTWCSRAGSSCGSAGAASRTVRSRWSPRSAPRSARLSWRASRA